MHEGLWRNNSWETQRGFLFPFKYFPIVSLAVTVTFGVPMTGMKF
jgi:hypothetical protein